MSALRSTTRHLAGGAVLFQRDDRVDRIFRVVSGEVRLVRWQKDGTTAILQRARPGDLLAEASLLSDRYHCGDWATGWMPDWPGTTAFCRNDGVLPERGVWRQLAEDLNVTPEALYRELARRRAA